MAHVQHLLCCAVMFGCLSVSALPIDCPRQEGIIPVFSKYHQELHCVCPEGKMCTGSLCSLGQAANGDIYRSTVHGYHAACNDCKCVDKYVLSSFEEMRTNKSLWIIGSHHKTGSFLVKNIWEREHLFASPPLRVKVNSFHPMTSKQWEKVSQDGTDVVVTFHAKEIEPGLQEAIGRPYKFIHVVRDPVEQVVSAFLYELQRIGTGVHDKYFKTVMKSKDDQQNGLIELAKMMEPDMATMADQYEKSKSDPNSLNIKMEDFQTNFTDTSLRMFSFLGVPPDSMNKFLKAASKEDLSTKSLEWKANSTHVTAGKYDRGPLRKVLLDSELGPRLLMRRKAMGY
eukprot:m.96861 g.96861  ORF g.96861 m.96861 type:complete len:341 (+) comp13568_c0_seq3:109-1131(+)